MASANELSIAAGNEVAVQRGTHLDAIMNTQFGWVPVRVNEALTVQWPKELRALMAFLQPDVVVERLMTEINRIANTPCPLDEREQQIAELEREIDRLQRTEEAIVVATGAPREAGCPPWVVLSVKTIKSPGVRRRVMSR